MEDLIQFLISGLSLGGLYALTALGLVIVFGVLRLINFAYGELIMVAGYTMFLLGKTPLPWLAVAALAVAAATLTAVLMERVAFRPVRNALPTTMLITSFAVSGLLQNAALLTISPRARGVRTPHIFVENFTMGGVLIQTVEMISLVVSILVLLLLVLFVRRTTIGIALRAAADDFVMTRLLGVSADRVIAVAFAISGLLAGISAPFWIGRSAQVHPAVGLNPVLVAFVASVMGGLESMVGAVVGGYVLGFLTVGLQFVLPQNLLHFRQAFTFGIVILVLLVRPQGLVGGRRSELL